MSREQKQIPRQDQRKVRIREDIKESIAISSSYEQFERLMKEKKCAVLKGRSIAFRDEKKVYVKASELGYSLQIVERIIEQNRLKQNQALTLEQWGNYIRVGTN